jgi:hypothetical protein
VGPALGDEFVDTVELEPLGLCPHRIRLGELVDGDVGGDVLGAGIDEVMVASLVSPVRTEPVAPRLPGERRGGRAAIVDHHHDPTPDERPRPLDPRCRFVLERCPGAVGCVVRQHCRQRVERGAQLLDETAVGKAHHVSLAPRTVVDRQAEGQVVEQFVGEDHAVEWFVGEVGSTGDTIGQQRSLLLGDLDGEVLQRTRAPR